MPSPRIISVPWLPRVQAVTLSPSCILVRRDRLGDDSLIAHELTHCSQMLKFGRWKFWWKYLTSQAFRLEVEIEAYQVQINLTPWSLESRADALSLFYCLGISKEQAETLLKYHKRYKD